LKWHLLLKVGTVSMSIGMGSMKYQYRGALRIALTWINCAPVLMRR
jgi:hypothetical protein